MVRVADIELEDAVAFGFQPRGMLVHWATDFVQDVLKLGRLRKGRCRDDRKCARAPGE